MALGYGGEFRTEFEWLLATWRSFCDQCPNSGIGSMAVAVALFITIPFAAVGIVVIRTSEDDHPLHRAPERPFQHR